MTSTFRRSLVRAQVGEPPNLLQILDLALPPRRGFSFWGRHTKSPQVSISV